MADENLVDELVDTKVIQPATDKVVTDDKGTTPLATDPAKASDDVRPAPVDWPTDWREKAAGGDAKKLSRLTRYASPQAIADALIAAQNKISAGDLKPALGKDAKPEEIAAYREAHGVPEAPDKYDLPGLEIPQDEKPAFDKFLTSAHQANMTPDQVRAAINAYTGISEDAKNSRLSADNDAKEKAEDALRSEWGSEFRTNINLITNLLDTAPQGLRDKLLHGRLADGTPIGSSPEALQFLAGLARDRNPSGVVVPSGVATESVMEDEITKIEKTMRENRTAYNRDEKMQARYRDLLVWREAQKGRRAA
jgi:hypothetical protein